MPRCDHCYTKLQVDESYDVQFEGEDGRYRDKVYGHCPKCEAQYQWDEIYVYQNFEHLIEVDN